MVRIFSIGLIASVIFFISCGKDAIDTPELTIKLLDDVTPMRVLFEVEDKYDSYHWVFNDTLVPSEMPTNKTIVVFSEPGKSKVGLTVYSNSSSKKISQEFMLPQGPRLVELYGFTPNHDFLEEAGNDSVLYFNFTYYNVDTTTGQRLMKLENNDLVYYFDKPISFEYSGFFLGEDDFGSLFDFKIYNQNKDKILISMPLYNKYKRNIIDRDLNDGGLKEMQLTYLGEGFYFNIDLKP